METIINFKTGDLVEWKQTGHLGTILEVEDKRMLGTTGIVGDVFVVVQLHGDVHFKNPTTMSLELLNRTARLINECR